jgi:hypothetical protein
MLEKRRVRMMMKERTRNLSRRRSDVRPERVLA